MLISGMENVQTCPPLRFAQPNGTYVRQVLYESLTTSRQATVFGGAKRRRLPANR